MRRPIVIALTVNLLFSLMTFATAKKEFLTEDELDIIREAQELNLRIPAYLDLAERRLVVLGLTDKSAAEKEKEKKDQQQYELAVKRAGPNGAVYVKHPVDDLAYLNKFTHAELLRGYIQALDESMDNIDHAYSDKRDVRGPVENLEKFTRESMPILEKFEAKNDAEKTALKDALDKAKEANDGAKEALKKVPKTQKKPVPARN